MIARKSRCSACLLWMDEIHFAPLKKPWNEDLFVNTNKQWSPMVSKWREMDSISGHLHGWALVVQPYWCLYRKRNALREFLDFALLLKTILVAAAAKRSDFFRPIRTGSQERTGSGYPICYQVALRGYRGVPCAARYSEVSLACSGSSQPDPWALKTGHLHQKLLTCSKSCVRVPCGVRTVGLWVWADFHGWRNPAANTSRSLGAVFPSDSIPRILGTQGLASQNENWWLPMLETGLHRDLGAAPRSVGVLVIGWFD